jgi:hypothetical protein
MAANPNWYLSGGGGNSNPNLSLGGQASSTPAPQSLFDNVSSNEAQPGDVEYRCIFVKNAGDVNLLTAKVWILQNTPDPDTVVAIGLDPSGLNGIPPIIANENTPPVGVSFSAPADEASAISLGTIGAGQSYPVWVRRTVLANAGPYNNDSFTLRVQGDTSV